jgi:hypothetical protein
LSDVSNELTVAVRTSIFNSIYFRPLVWQTKRHSPAAKDNSYHYIFAYLIFRVLNMEGENKRFRAER